MLATSTATTTLCDRFPSASSRRTRTIRRMQKNRMTTTATSSSSEEEEKEAEPIPPKKSDPFGFDSGRNEGPVPIVPGFDTAEGGKVGPLGTAGISLLLFVLFGGSLFFTSVPRGAVEDMAKMALENDPDAPTNVLRRYEKLLL